MTTASASRPGRGRIFDSITQTIGDTPLVRLNRLPQMQGIKAQILDMLAELRARRGLTYLFISHNLAVVRQVCAEVAVMYLGRIVEQGSAEQVLGAPRHPYTQALLASVPRLTAGAVPPATPSEPPNPAALPSGCTFHPRCRRAELSCHTGNPPPLVEGLACPPVALSICQTRA